MQEVKNKYYPQLNALRGIGVLSVFFVHAFKPEFTDSLFSQFAKFLFDNVYLSMDMFFALSAFIITHLALQEYQNHSRFSFKNFIVRRVLRIWPLYFIILAVTFWVLQPLANKYSIPFSLPDVGWYIFFISNFYTEPHIFYLRQLWSVSVEEQFYILWGLVLLAGQRYITWVSIAAMALGVGFCLYAASASNVAYYHSLLYLFSLMVGALFAYLNFLRSKVTNWASQAGMAKNMALYLFIPLFFIVYFIAKRDLEPHVFEYVSVFMRALYITHHCFMFIDQMENENSFFNLRKARVLIYFGEISYGMYCWHGIIITFLYKGLEQMQIGLGKGLNAILAFIITVIVATLSYRFIEKPFLKLKRHFS